MPKTDDAEPPRRAGRAPSPAKTERTRAALLDAAAAAFLDKGFAATRMIDVAARAGVAKGTVYLYFPDKDAMFEQVLRAVIAEPMSALEARAPRPGESVRAFLERVVLPLFSDAEAGRRVAVLRLMISEAIRSPEVAATYRRVVIDPNKDALARLGRAAADRGEVRSDALARFPQLLIAPVVIATLWNALFARGDAIDPGEAFAAFLDLVFSPPA